MAAAMDVDEAGGEERRPSEKELFRAAESGDAAAFASLAPADLSLRNEDGRSLLHVAAAAGHPQARKGAFYALESNMMGGNWKVGLGFLTALWCFPGFRWCSRLPSAVVTPRLAC
jgi:hypothetical protein